jgi:hypothetical protein
VYSLDKHRGQHNSTKTKGKRLALISTREGEDPITCTVDIEPKMPTFQGL